MSPTPDRTEHRLQLPRDTDPADVLAMIRNIRPEAHADEHGVIDLGEDARLVPDTSRRGGGRFTLEVPRLRDEPTQLTIGDPRGYARAFPDGEPMGAEREALDLAWALGRRLYGAVVTDSGTRLEPHPFCERDLTVVSPHALAPESFAELIAPLAPEAELDEIPEDVPRSGYSVTVPLETGDELAVRVGRADQHPALAQVDWLRDAVDYQIVHLPVDEGEGGIEMPDAATSERWQVAYQRVGLIAGLLTETVGGYVLDAGGFLVDPADLA